MEILQFIMGLFGSLFSSFERLNILGIGTLRTWLIFIGVISITTAVVWRVLGLSMSKQKIDKTNNHYRKNNIKIVKEDKQ